MASTSIEIPEEIYIEALELYVQALIDKYDQLGLRASGQWADELEIEINGTRGIIKGMEYTEQLVDGRFPGTPPPIRPIKSWVEKKLGLSGDEAVSAAYAVSRKIGKEGTEIYKKGGTDLLEALNDPELFKVFTDKIGDYMRVQISSILLNQLKTLKQ